MEILIRYTAPVVVYGAPRLWLDLGDSDGYAEFEAPIDGTNDTLLFLYSVREGASVRARARVCAYVICVCICVCLCV